MRANLHLNGERPKGERAKWKKGDGSTMQSLMMVKAVQKFHDKINALNSPEPIAGADRREEIGQSGAARGRIEAATRNASLLLPLTMISQRDFRGRRMEVSADRDHPYFSLTHGNE